MHETQQPAAPATTPGAAPTPGPWRVGNNYGSVVSDNRPAGYPYDEAEQHYGGFVIAETCTEENARAIAALPELQQIARDVRSWWTEDERRLDMNDIVDRIDAALAKATGSAS